MITVGSFRAFRETRSARKWVYTHRTGKWAAFYAPDVMRLTKDFMDCFLKDDTSSGFLDVPPVRLEVRSSRDVIHEGRYEREWPRARTVYERWYRFDVPGEGRHVRYEHGAGIRLDDGRSGRGTGDRGRRAALDAVERRHESRRRESLKHMPASVHDAPPQQQDEAEGGVAAR